jgi:4-alpha-glucanotransferase
MKTITVLWVAHFHQPIGNFPEVLQRYTKEVCEPFMACVEAAETVSMSVHFSGVLLEYFEEYHPQFLQTLKRLSEAGRIELLGGGFYEPVLSMIPREDAQEQLIRMADWLEKHLGRRPQGAWLPEYVWGQATPELLRNAGYDYTILKGEQLVTAGIKPAGIHQAYRTEYLRHSVTLFPTQRAWSKAIPYQPLEETMSGFKRVGNRDEPQIIVIAQRGDQFEIMGQKENVLKKDGVLSAWLRRMGEEKSWIKTSTLREHYQTLGQLPLVYVQASGSNAVESGALPASAQNQFQTALNDLKIRHDFQRFEPYLHGGAWLGFLGKYPEVDFLHKKMLWLREAWNSMPKGTKKDRALTLILQSQCHSAYWHVERGGCYANYLRDAIFQRLIEAEVLIFPKAPAVRSVDLDANGSDEILLRDDRLLCVIEPCYGGGVREFSDLKSRSNLANTFTRRSEGYHSRLKVEYHTDWFRRQMFQDHFVKPGVTLRHFQDGTFVEYGDFVNQPYQVKNLGEREVTLSRQGGIYKMSQGEGRPLLIEKTFRLGEVGEMEVQYMMKNIGKLPMETWFIQQNNYTCLSGDSADRMITSGESSMVCGCVFEVKAGRDIFIEDKTRDIGWKWTLSQAAQIMHHPVETLSILGTEPRWDYQGSALLFIWPLHLQAGETFAVTLKTKLR